MARLQPLISKSLAALAWMTGFRQANEIGDLIGINLRHAELQKYENYRHSLLDNFLAHCDSRQRLPHQRRRA